MKRYLLFGGDYYYPLGGMNDLYDSFDDEAESISVGKALEAQSRWDWWHIYDSLEGKCLN